MLGSFLGLSPGCSDTSPEPPKEPEKRATDSTQGLIDEIFGPATPMEELPPLAAPLAFVPLSRGLPVGGTWREQPLLHDFTGDGRADLVASNREEDGLSTWRAPAGPEGSWELRIGGIPRDLMYGGSAAADLDGNGSPDLLYVAHSEGLKVFLNDGSMGWIMGEPLPNPFLMLDVATGDLNGDGLHDAAGIGHFHGGVGLYLGDGKGGFTRSELSGEIVPADWFGTQIEVADLDQDGLDDLILCTNKGAKVRYTRKLEESGALTWEDGSAGLPNPTIGNALRGLVPGDFTGDGKLELAFCSLSDPGIPEAERDDGGVLQRNEDGVWTRIDRGLPRGLAYGGVGVADIDRDGNLDLLLVAKGQEILVMIGDGTGGFELKGTLPGTRHARSIAMGDVDADGWMDVAVLSSDSKHRLKGGGLQVLLNRPELWRGAGKE